MTKPFGPTSPWNTPIPTGASYVATSALVGQTGWVENSDYGMPVYFTDASLSPMTVSVGWSWGQPPASYVLRMPSTAQPAAGTDANFVIVDLVARKAYDFWNVRRTGPTTFSASAAGVAELDGSGFGSISSTGQVLNVGIRAAGNSTLGGMLTGENFVEGRIDHALAMSAPDSVLYAQYLSPAVAIDQGGESFYRGSLPMGTRLAIPRGTPMPTGMSLGGRMLFEAFVQYGAFILDRSGGTMGIYTDPGSVTYEQVKPMRETWAPGGSDLQKLIPLLKIVR